MMIDLIEKIHNGIESCFDTILLPIFLLLIRFWMGSIFWYSGLTKISNWEDTLSSFKDGYKVPIIPYEFAAYLATSIELVCPILLALGLGARLATLPMLAMTAVIQLTYADMTEHYHWAILLGVILLYGPGWISLDHLISRRWSSSKN